METSASEVTKEKIRATEIAKTKSFGGAINTANKASFRKEKKKKTQVNCYSDIYLLHHYNTQKPKGLGFTFFFFFFFFNVLSF